MWPRNDPRWTVGEENSLKRQDVLSRVKVLLEVKAALEAKLLDSQFNMRNEIAGLNVAIVLLENLIGNDPDYGL
jgi:hypothetical protein